MLGWSFLSIGSIGMVPDAWSQRIAHCRFLKGNSLLPSIKTVDLLIYYTVCQKCMPLFSLINGPLGLLKLMGH